MFFFGPKIENKEPDAQNARQRTRRPTLITMNPSIPTADYDTTFPPQTKKCGRGNKIMVGMVVNAKVGELEEEIREEFLRRLRKDITGVVQVFWGKRMYLVRFQYGLDKEMSSNQLTIVFLKNHAPMALSLISEDQILYLLLIRTRPHTYLILPIVHPILLNKM